MCLSKRNFRDLATLFVLVLSISINTITSQAIAKAKPAFPPLSANYSIKNLNTMSTDDCAYTGYAEVEVVLGATNERYQLKSFTVFAIANNQRFKVGSHNIIAGYSRYPIEFFAGECTNSLDVEFSI
ncbi:hypothetical protein ACFO4O_11040 [Glaciecola siphonariae]|uniref:Uncharacterized protein n=1 Tax=Glaciecola siphonariae TaxID=521012 RepID=A0ABV9LVZ2_9ALTE